MATDSKVLEAMADAFVAEKAATALRDKFLAKVNADPALLAQYKEEKAAFVESQRRDFEENIKKFPADEQAALKKASPWLYGDTRKANDPAFMYFAPQINFTAGGLAFFSFRPTDKLIRLQLEQSLMLGVVQRGVYDDKQYWWHRNAPYSAPVGPEGAAVWFAQFKTDRLRDKVAWGVQHIGLQSDDTPLMILASGGTAGFAQMGANAGLRSVLLAVAADVSINTGLALLSEHYAKEVNTGVLVILAALIARKGIKTPAFQRFASQFFKEELGLAPKAITGASIFDEAAVSSRITSLRRAGTPEALAEAENLAAGLKAQKLRALREIGTPEALAEAAALKRGLRDVTQASDVIVNDASVLAFLDAQGTANAKQAAELIRSGKVKLRLDPDLVGAAGQYEGSGVIGLKIQGKNPVQAAETVAHEVRHFLENPGRLGPAWTQWEEFRAWQFARDSLNWNNPRIKSLFQYQTDAELWQMIRTKKPYSDLPLGAEVPLAQPSPK